LEGGLYIYMVPKNRKPKRILKPYPLDFELVTPKLLDFSHF